MSRLIDADALMRCIPAEEMASRMAVANSPTIEERKKGKWIYLIGLEAFECSVCGRQMVRNIFDYCPWCGADMRTKETDSDYERAVEQLEHDMLYEPTLNQDDGSM